MGGQQSVPIEGECGLFGFGLLLCCRGVGASRCGARLWRRANLQHAVHGEAAQQAEPEARERRGEGEEEDQGGTDSAWTLVLPQLLPPHRSAVPRPGDRQGEQGRRADLRGEYYSQKERSAADATVRIAPFCRQLQAIR